MVYTLASIPSQAAPAPPSPPQPATPSASHCAPASPVHPSSPLLSCSALPLLLPHVATPARHDFLGLPALIHSICHTPTLHPIPAPRNPKSYPHPPLESVRSRSPNGPNGITPAKIVIPLHFMHHSYGRDTYTKSVKLRLYHLLVQFPRAPGGAACGAGPVHTGRVGLAGRDGRGA